MNPNLIFLLMMVPLFGASGLLVVLLREQDTDEFEDLREHRIRSLDVDVDRGSSYLDPAAPQGSTASALRNLLRATAGQRLDRSERGRVLATELARADLRLRSEEWILLVFIVSAASGLLAMLRFKSPIALPVGALVGYLLTGRYLAFRKSRRQKKFEAGLGEVILTISNGIKAGYTFNAAIQNVANNSPYPLNSEFSRVQRSVSLGANLDDALDALVRRNDSEDLELLIAAVKINRTAGGNLSEILDTIEETIRGRLQVKGDIRTLTAQARASGYIIALLPVVLAGFLSLVSPQYFTPMFHKPLGLAMLGASGLAILMGSAIIRKIVTIKV